MADITVQVSKQNEVWIFRAVSERAKEWMGIGLKLMPYEFVWDIPDTFVIEYLEARGVLH